MENQTLQKRRHPQRQVVYTLREIVEVLELRDSPCLEIRIYDKQCVIQESHVPELEALLNIPGFAETRWTYLLETHEWIPVFKYWHGNSRPITDFVDFEKTKDPFDPKRPEHRRENFWVTPKGSPRPQYDYEAD